MSSSSVHLDMTGHYTTIDDTQLAVLDSCIGEHFSAQASESTQGSSTTMTSADEETIIKQLVQQVYETLAMRGQNQYERFKSLIDEELRKNADSQRDDSEYKNKED